MTLPALVTVKGSEGGIELRAFAGSEQWSVVWMSALDALTLADRLTILAEVKVPLRADR